MGVAWTYGQVKRLRYREGGSNTHPGVVDFSLSFVLSDHPAFGICHDCSFRQTPAFRSSISYLARQGPGPSDCSFQNLKRIQITISSIALQYKRLSVNGSVGLTLSSLVSLKTLVPDTRKQSGELLADIIHNSSYIHCPYNYEHRVLALPTIKPHHPSSHKRSNSPNSQSHARWNNKQHPHLSTIPSDSFHFQSQKVYR